ncbi:MAG: lysozyme inhibitor LprI family protein [Cyclobacteriaceae bacterium]
MRDIFATILLTFFIGVTANCQTQAEMNREAAEDYKKADAELNKVYQRVIQKYGDDPTFLDALRTSQRNWITFRDSELKMKYPDREAGWYGSIHPMCVSNYMAELTNERTAKLTTWLAGIEEGDACTGSVKTRFENEETELLEQFDEFDFVRLLNELKFINSYQTDELSIKLMSSSNLPGSAGFASGEVTTNIWIAVSEFGELPEQILYRVNSLYAPKITDFDDSDPKHPVLTLEHQTDEEFNELFLRISIEVIEQL